MHANMPVIEAIERLKEVFLEMPGSQLTPPQASALAGVELAICGVVLEALADSRFLARTDGGRFVRRSPDSLPS
jgi:hypothetical protein